MKKYKRTETGVRKGKVALIFNEFILSGDCTFTAEKFGKVARFQISFIKEIPAPKKEKKSKK